MLWRCDYNTCSGKGIIIILSLKVDVTDMLILVRSVCTCVLLSVNFPAVKSTIN